jgi:2-polyprenyl-3-methyl-5-hydroxy-6-metoxy-1,4-benzoquinol methylase
VATYYTNVRKEIAPMLAAPVGVVLEVGCAAGGTLRWLKEEFGASRTVGVEINEKLGDDVRSNADVALIGDGASTERAAAHGPYDLILFMDVLEHLTDPWGTLLAYRALLAPAGRMIICVPNVGHYSVVLDLLRHRFDYQDEGIMDRTHLRFFVPSSARQLLEQAGLSVDYEIRLIWPTKRLTRLANMVFGKLAVNFLTSQYILRSAPQNQPAENPLRENVWKA